MTKYRILMTRQAEKDRDKIKSAKSLRKNVEGLIELLQMNPFQTPPFYEKLVGDMDGLFSRRINRQHRLVYQVREEENVVVILRMWTHYE